MLERVVVRAWSRFVRKVSAEGISAAASDMKAAGVLG